MGWEIVIYYIEWVGGGCDYEYTLQSPSDDSRSVSELSCEGHCSELSAHIEACIVICIIELSTPKSPSMSQ